MDLADCVIVLWTRVSIKSEWVRIEAAEGLKRKNMIPIIIDDEIEPHCNFACAPSAIVGQTEGFE